MTPEEYLQETSERMRADGSTVSAVSFTGGPAVVGYQAEFRMSWMATKLHLFTVVVAVPQATVDVLSNVTAQALDYAKKTKGKFRGFQSGVAVIPVVVAAGDGRCPRRGRDSSRQGIRRDHDAGDRGSTSRAGLLLHRVWCCARSPHRGCVSVFR